MPWGYLCPLVGIPPGHAGRESGSVAAPRGTVQTTLSNEAPTEKSLLARPRPGAARASLGARCRPVRRNPLSCLLRGRDTVADQACGLSLRAALLSPRNPVDLCHFAHDALQRSPPPIDTAAPRQGVQSAARLPTLTQSPKRRLRRTAGDFRRFHRVPRRARPTNRAAACRKRARYGKAIAPSCPGLGCRCSLVPSAPSTQEARQHSTLRGAQVGAGKKGNL